MNSSFNYDYMNQYSYPANSITNEDLLQYLDLIHNDMRQMQYDMSQMQYDISLMHYQMK